MKRVEEEQLIPPHNRNLEHEEAIRSRAFQIYQQRGMADGLDVDDWLQAEAEIVEPHRTQKAA